METIGISLVEAYLQFITAGADFSFVDSRGSSSEIGGDGTVRTEDEYVGADVPEEFQVTGKQTVQERIVDADVQLAYYFPMDVLVADGGLPVPGIDTSRG